MSKYPTHPLDYLDDLGIDEVWRFILSHPDMDHMDGIDPLFREKRVVNYWDSGVRRRKPQFNGGSPDSEADWDRYQSILDGTEQGLQVLQKQHGASFAHANEPKGDHDGLRILAPDRKLVASVDDETNDASYVVLYHSAGGKILMPGDAHDETWGFVLQNYPEAISDCSILVAPHHGRDSNMDFSFLEVVNPKIVLMGAANSKDLAYDKYRRFETITNNQAGNVVAETNSSGGLDVFVQNEKFAVAAGRAPAITNAQGYTFYLAV